MARTKPTSRIFRHLLSSKRYGVLEVAPAGKQMRPEALENNFFVKPGSGGYELYGIFDGSVTKTLSLSDVNSGQIPSTPATKNQEGDPLLDGTWHLQSGSPCIDTGTTVEAPPKDREGETRPKGAGIDIGADERE